MRRARRAARAAALLCLALVAGGAEAAPPAAEAGAAEPGFPALEALEREVRRLSDTAGRSVVSVLAHTNIRRLLRLLGDEITIEGIDEDEAPLARRLGSGVVLDDRGHVATLASVVEGATDVTVILADGRRLRAQVKGTDRASGLAVLSVPDEAGLRPVRFGDAAALGSGSLVATVGSPGGAAPVVALGVVSGTGVSQGPQRRGAYLRLSAYTAPGAAGGAVFDRKGEFVGMIFAARGAAGRRRGPLVRWEAPLPDEEEAADDEGAGFDAPGGSEAFGLLKTLHGPGEAGGGISYAVPGNVVRLVTDQLIRSGAVERGWIGITFEEDEGGLHLVRVLSGSPAERAGLRSGDRIVAIDGAPLRLSVVQLEEAAAMPPGTLLELGVLRDERVLTLPLRLGRAPAPVAPPPLAFLAPHEPLGVKVDEPDGETRARLGADPGTGMLVRNVYEGSRAEAAGLRPGDLIVGAMGRPVRSVHDLRRALSRQALRASQGRPEPMPMAVLRSGRPLEVKIAAPSRTPAPEASPAPAARPVPPPPRRPRD